METKKAIVTGGDRGIGRGIVRKLASLGFDVAYSYHSKEDAAVKLQQELASVYGVKGYFYQASLEKPGQAEILFDKALQDLGGLDVLVNNAGLTINYSILTYPTEKLDEIINLDFRSYIIMIQKAANYFVDHGIPGNIVNITSIHGERAYPTDSMYGAMKAALNRAIQSMAIELGPHGIRINNVAPGYIRIRYEEDREDVHGHLDDIARAYDTVSKMIPIPDYGRPEDIANAVAFFISDESAYISGYTLTVDGGLILPGMPEDPQAETNIKGWTQLPRRKTGGTHGE